MRRLVAILAALLGMAGLLAGCGGSSSGSSTASKTKVIHITFSGSSVTPNGARVDVKVGQKVEFVVKADTAGQIHVHSSPEKQLDYNAGTTEIQVGSFAQPGLIEVESHALDKTIVQLQVQ
jgi:hypothetical protein